MQFLKSEYMKLITRSDIEKRLNFEAQDLYNNDESDIYYSKIIDEFQKDNKHVWNWAAASLQCKWLIYRGMFFYAFLYSLLYIFVILPPLAICFVLALNIPGHESLIYTGLIIFIGILCLNIDPVSFFILGKYGNRLYIRFLDKKNPESMAACAKKKYSWLASTFSLLSQYTSCISNSILPV